MSLLGAVAAPIGLAGANRPAGAATAAGPDHFQCYSAAASSTAALKASFRAKPGTVALKNSVATAAFSARVGKVATLCNPAHQTARIGGRVETTAVTNAKARLVCWSLTANTVAAASTVTVTNQFGTGTLRPVKARSLCLPSWKNGARPLRFPSTPAPANLNSYVCYSAVHPDGTSAFMPPALVTLRDQFGAATVHVGAAVALCAPTSRRTSSGAWSRIVSPTKYLVCFALPTRAAGTPISYDKNGFGTGAIKAAHDTQLCVPSVVATAGAPPTTTRPAPTAAPTTTPTSAPTTAAPTTTTTIPAAAHWTPSSAAPISWYWQLQGAVNTSISAQVYEVDGFNTSAATVAALHAQEKKVICYIDFGTSETNRPDIGAFPASVQGFANGFPGELWLDIRQLAVLEPIMTARMQMCVSKGFDALEADNVDGYTNATGFPLTAADQLAYNEWIAGAAHDLGLSVGLKNDNGQAAQLQPYFDWALDEQCNEFSQCATENAFTAANKAVFNAEYSGAAFCSSDVAAHLNGALFDVGLTGAVYQPCTGTW